MSGQPYRYEKDIANFRNDYMTQLGLRANLDDMNLQANKIYKDTGALPPQSTLKDTRSTSEVLADTEKLKLTLIGELKPICTTQMAQLVVQRIQNSPLNADGSFLIWFAQNVTELVLNLKKKYKFGIVGDDNDAEQMVLFMSSLYAKTKDFSQTVKSAFDRPTNNVLGGIDAGDLEALSRLYNEIQFRLISKIIDPKTAEGIIMRKILIDIRDQFDALGRNLINANYNRIKQLFLATSYDVNAWKQQSGINTLGYTEFIEYLNKLPSATMIRTLIEQLEKSERNKSQNLSIQILENLSSILPTVINSDETNNFIRRVIESMGAVIPIQQRGLTANELRPVSEFNEEIGAFNRLVDRGATPSDVAQLTSVEERPYAGPEQGPAGINQMKYKPDGALDTMIDTYGGILNEARTNRRIKTNEQFKDFIIDKIAEVENQMAQIDLKTAYHHRSYPRNRDGEVEVSWDYGTNYTSQGIFDVLQYLTDGFDIKGLRRSNPVNADDIREYIKSNTRASFTKGQLQPLPDEGQLGGYQTSLPTGTTTESIADIMSDYILSYINDTRRDRTINSDEKFKREILGGIPQIESNMDIANPKWRQILNYNPMILEKVLRNSTRNYDLAYTKRRKMDKAIIKAAVRIQSPEGQMKGFGLKKRRGRPKGSGLVKPISERIDHTKGIKQGHTHVPFGKYILNKNKLDSDLVYFKHTKGYGVKGFPMAKVSKNLGSVLRTIIGGGVPKFDDLQGLTNEEKEYLHKVANKAGIMDKVSIPTPSKDLLEQQIHQFEVMKGELLAGNDSPELIKKFKLILLRLSKNGTIPKREASELMEELLQLGF